MMLTWIPRLQLVRQGKTIGWIHLTAVKSAALPRVGEVVAFEDRAVLDAIGPGTLAWSSPTVTNVEHVSTDGEFTTYVVIEVHPQRTAEQLADGAESNGFNWTPKSD